ncbi:Ubiquitin-protein ligase [Perkinsus olseni]|uniref:HECT-type E3 ubiquitin transferase n=1 Tax=Perkinsus olseni TaxID=32597 RepID=A0A7J6MY84_PEROL|nr:Ubiquitin-protein ligase [Perkinsus olseni]
MKRESEASRDTAAEESSLHPETPTDMGVSDTPDARPDRNSARIDMGALGTFLRQVGGNEDSEKDTSRHAQDDDIDGGMRGASSSSSSFPEGLAFLMSAVSSGGLMQRITSDLKADDSIRVIAALTELNDVLNMSGEEIALGFPVETAVPLLVKHVEKDDPQDEGDDPDTRRLLATRCIYSLLDILPSATARVLANSERGLTTLCDKLRSITNIDLAEQCIRVLYRLSSEQPTALFCAGGVEALLQCMDFFTTYCQDQALSAVKNMVRMARVDPEKWEKYLVEPPCCLNQLTAVLGHADTNMQARAAETWKGMLNNLPRVYSTPAASSPASSAPSSPRMTAAASSSSAMGRMLNRFRSNSRILAGAEQRDVRKEEPTSGESRVSSKALSRGAEKLMGENGERLKQMIERAQQELDHPSSTRTSTGVVTDLLACIATVVACSDKLAAMAMQQQSMQVLLDKLLADGDVAEELSRQALKTAEALLPPVRLDPSKAGATKKIDVFKVLRLSGESSRQGKTKSAVSPQHAGRSVPRELLVKLLTGAVACAAAAADQQDSMQLVLSGSMYARQRGWNLTATHPELIDGVISSLADIMDQQCSAPRYSPSLLLACLHTILCLTPKGKSVQITQDLACRYGVVKLLREIQEWKEPVDASPQPAENANDMTTNARNASGSSSSPPSSSILVTLRRSSRSGSLNAPVERHPNEASNTPRQETTFGWLTLLKAEASQALRILDREKDAGVLANRQMPSRSGEVMNLEAFTAFAASSSLPTPYELLQSGMLEEMCDFVARGHEADEIRKVLAENPEFYEHMVKCLVSAIDRHRLLTLALNPVSDGGMVLPSPSTGLTSKRGGMGSLGLQLLGKPIRLKLEHKKKEAATAGKDADKSQQPPQSSSSSSTAGDTMRSRLRRALSFRSKGGAENSPRRGHGEGDLASLMPPSLMVTVEPLASIGAVCGYILQRVKFIRRCLGPGHGGSSEFIEDLLLGDEDEDDEEAFLMGLHGDDDMELDDEDEFDDDDDMMLDEDEGHYHPGEHDDDEDADDLPIFSTRARRRSDDGDDGEDTLGRGRREADEEAIKRMVAEACGRRGRGHSTRRRASGEDKDLGGLVDEHDSPRSASRSGRGGAVTDRKSKSDCATTPVKAQEPTGVVIFLDGRPIPSHLTAVQAVWLAASRESSGALSAVGTDESAGVVCRASSRSLRNAKPPPEKVSRFTIAADVTNERIAEEVDDGGKADGAGKPGISAVISTIWGTTHNFEFELTFDEGDEKKSEGGRLPSTTPFPHEPKAVVCDRPLAMKERVKAAAEAVEEHFGQLEGQHWDGLDRLVELLVSLSKLRPKDSPVRWSNFACLMLSKRQLAASSSPLALITNIPADLKASVVGKGTEEVSRHHTKLVSVAPVLFDTETRRRVMASSCFGLHRALQSISEATTAATDTTSSSTSQQLTALPRQKVRIRREKLLESAVVVMNVFGAGKGKASAALEVEFLGEVGTGSGPTNEFYACVAEELKKVPCFSRDSESRLFPMPVAEQDGCNAEAYRKVLAAAAEQRKNPPKTTPERSDHSPAHRGRSNSEVSDISEAAGDVTASIGIGSPAASPANKDGDGANKGSSRGKGTTVESDSNKSLPSVLEAWRLAGHIVARCILDNRLVDLDIHPVMWELVKEILATEDVARVELPCVYYLSQVDPTLHRTLLSLKGMAAEELRALEISAAKVPGYEKISLPGLRGNVTCKNVGKVVEGVATAVTYTGVYWQLRAFADAFAEILSPSALSLWRSEDELTELTYGSSAARPEYWTKEHLLSAIQPKHGYTSSSSAVQYLVEVMANELTPDQRQQLVRFLTGSPTLPIGGFAALKPQLTVVRQVLDDDSANPDDFLPSVMTCASFMKLPDYSSKEVLKRQLVKAISEGQKAFLMS